MVAPTTPDPDLSAMVPEKLPVAWPYMAGEMASVRAQAARKSVTLWVIVSAKPSADFGHFSFILVRFMFKPLFRKSAKVVLHGMLWIKLD